ncbi:probable tyrosyl-DNA phosphodiesterase [Euwallacea fornicatus]|uniref:probable tyrosyl-DNA phosphodiesterase n=1 Tax=Euwallacea fornicatus TaxID=995702 RepID=UPI00338F73DE
MESSSKRKTQEYPGSQAKKMKLEECPHKERCYRRNPHHFKQFDHPFLIKLIEMGDLMVIPENMPQPNQVYKEQIEILKPILASLRVHESVEKVTDNAEAACKSEHMTKADTVPGGSGSTSTEKVSQKCKTTIFNSTSQIFTSEEDQNACPPGSMLEKLQRNAPYNFFFTAIPKSPETLKEVNTISFTDLICPSLGQLKCSLQVNFIIDIDWLLKQYKTRNLHEKPLTIVYGDDWPDIQEFMNKFCPNVKYHFVKMKDPFGCHHTKLGVYVYEDDSIRVVVSTANLYFEDWNHYNQGVWVSPRLPKLPPNADSKLGDSPTGFKTHLINYFLTYQLTIFNEWVDYIKRADFSSVKVALVYSAPGKYYPKSNGNHLYRVGDLLSQHCTLPPKTDAQSEGPLSWGILAQASSIGSMGKTAGEWLRGSLLRSLASHKLGPLPNNSQATISVVYPSVSNVANGYWGLESGGCLPYSKATNEKQRWFQTYLHQWIADGKHRTRAMPHIKSYCRISPNLSKLAYFLLTSANLSKSAWGNVMQKNGASYVRSYEMGVMFLPKFFNEEYFEICDTEDRTNKSLFPFMYDLPLTPYQKNDYPWCN